MRIAYMLTSLGRGGAERQTIGIAERMASCGHQVKLIVLKPAEAHDWPTSLPVIHLAMHKSVVSICSGLVCAHRQLRGFTPDIVHSHTFPANMAARLLRIAGSAPVVLSTIHNVYEGGWWRTALYGLTDGLSIHTTAVSHSVAEHQIQTHAVPSGKCSVVTNGIDIANFTPNRDRRNVMRSKLHAEDHFIWLAAGRLTSAKNYPNLLEAFAQVLAASSHAELWIAGGGRAAEETRLRQLADTLGVSGPLRWLGLRDDISALLDAADAFVLSSAWEGLPLIVAEAMAMQKPVVATDVGGVSELIGPAGVTISPNNSKALADAMLGVMQMPENGRHAMGQQARERIRERFDIDDKVEEWQALYSKLLRNAAERQQR